MLFDAIKVKLGEVLKTERFFLVMLSEVLKMMQQKPEDTVIIKNKRIAAVLDHLRAQVNSKDFNIDLQPLVGLNWEEIRIGDEDALEVTDTPLLRADHNSLPSSQKIKVSKLRSAKNSVFHQASGPMSRLEVGRARSPQSAKGKQDSKPTNVFKRERTSTPSGVALINLLKSRP